MGYSDSLLTGIAQYLQAGGVGVYNDTTGYAVGDVGIVLTARMPDSPDSVICLAAYGVEDDITGPDDVIGVQVRTRSAATDGTSDRDLADDVFDRLHSLHDAALPNAVKVTQCLRQSWTTDGEDENNRPVTIQNFYLTVPRVSAHRP